MRGCWGGGRGSVPSSVISFFQEETGKPHLPNRIPQWPSTLLSFSSSSALLCFASRKWGLNYRSQPPDLRHRPTEQGWREIRGGQRDSRPGQHQQTGREGWTPHSQGPLLLGVYTGPSSPCTYTCVRYKDAAMDRAGQVDKGAKGP